MEICARIQTLWNMLRGGEPAKVSRDATPITDWMVLNESPSGFALMHVAGTIEDMAPGDALGLRTAPGRPWNIGLIRWARSDNPEHFELGLEMISPTAIPVEVVQPLDQVRRLAHRDRHRAARHGRRNDELDSFAAGQRR